MGVPCNPEVQQVMNCFIGGFSWNGSFPHQASQYLGDLNSEQMGSMHGFLNRTEPLLDALPSRCLKKRFHVGGRIQNDHGASRSSRTIRAVSTRTATGLR